MSLYNELNRRNVLRIGAAYLVVAWLVVQIAETIFPLFGFSQSPARIVVIVLAIGFIPALIAAWVLELTPRGLARDSGQGPGTDPAANRRLDRIINLSLVLALALIAVHTFIIDPDYASAHAGLAMATMFPSNSPEEQARAAFHVERAMVLDPTLAEAHVATGRLLWNQLKLEEALTAFRRAVQINPNFAIVCTNNPYEAVWQPAEETCDDG